MPGSSACASAATAPPPRTARTAPARRPRRHHATAHAPRHMPRRARHDRHDPSSVVPNNQTMERLPVRQATFGMVCRRYMLLESGRMGAAVPARSNTADTTPTRNWDWDQDQKNPRTGYDI